MAEKKKDEKINPKQCKKARTDGTLIGGLLGGVGGALFLIGIELSGPIGWAAWAAFIAGGGTIGFLFKDATTKGCRKVKKPEEEKEKRE